jgi:hypothetical protein
VDGEDDVSVISAQDDDARGEVRHVLDHAMGCVVMRTHLDAFRFALLRANDSCNMAA